MFGAQGVPPDRPHYIANEQMLYAPLPIVQWERLLNNWKNIDTIRCDGFFVSKKKRLFVITEQILTIATIDEQRLNVLELLQILCVSFTIRNVQVMRHAGAFLSAADIVARNCEALTVMVWGNEYWDLNQFLPNVSHRLTIIFINFSFNSERWIEIITTYIVNNPKLRWIQLTKVLNILSDDEFFVREDFTHTECSRPRLKFQIIKSAHELNKDELYRDG